MRRESSRDYCEKIQRQYYTETAHLYDEWHTGVDSPHYLALMHITSFVNQLGISSMLDVGCGTGQGVKYFLEKHPGMRVLGVDPVQALLDQAVHKNGIPRQLLIRGVGESLPFENDSFDSVCALGVLHHVKEPNILVGEMMRVAKKSVFLSDNNRFGKGPILRRLSRLLLYKLRLWNTVYFIKTRGKGCRISKGDGLSYSYSVYDSYDILAKWADRIILIPTTKPTRINWHHPLLTSSHILLCAVKDR